MSAEKRMSVKKRIFLLNITTIFASMLILLLVTTMFIRTMISNYINSDILITDVDENAVIIKAMLGKLDQEFKSWEVFESELEEYQYELAVSQNGKMIYNSIDDELPDNVEAFMEHGNSGIHTMYGFTLVDGVVKLDQETYYVLIVQSGAVEGLKEEINQIFKKFSYYFAAIGGLTILILVFITWPFSRRLIENIMKPLALLTSGAKRIADGDMEQPIEHTGDREFEEVCQAFNSMQVDVKRHEEERKKYEQARTDMVTSISHDLRTPLTSIKGYIKGILDGVANTQEKQEQYLKTAYDATEDMDILLQKLFVFSKIETGKMPFDFIRVSLSEYINQYAASREQQYLNKGLEIRLQIAESGYEGGYDIVQIQRVFDNLLENSLKYANRQYVIVEIGYKETREEEIITFKDNGNGVPYDKLPFIFDRFFRADESRGTEGNGVGLYIVQYIVEEHGGSVTAENRNGLVITMHFPKNMNKALYKSERKEVDI